MAHMYYGKTLHHLTHLDNVCTCSLFKFFKCKTKIKCHKKLKLLPSFASKPYDHSDMNSIIINYTILVRAILSLNGDVGCPCA